MTSVEIVLISVIILFLFSTVMLVGGFGGANRPVVNTPQCNDVDSAGNPIDNDNDGKKNSADAGCHTDLNAENAASYDPNLNNEFADQAGSICKTDDDCASNINGKKCLNVYPGDFIPFCGCITNGDCMPGGSCGPYNKCT